MDAPFTTYAIGFCNGLTKSILISVPFTNPKSNKRRLFSPLLSLEIPKICAVSFFLRLDNLTIFSSITSCFFKTRTVIFAATIGANLNASPSA